MFRQNNVKIYNAFFPQEFNALFAAIPGKVPWYY